jgi:hypothetical protein
MPRIGELLIAEGVLSEVAVQSALGFQRHTGEPFRLGTILLDRALLSEESLLKALSALHRCDYVTWPEILKTSPHVVRLLPERTAVRLAAIAYALEGRGLRVAFKNPSNLAAVDEVSAVTNRPIIPAVISEVRLLQALHLFYGRPIPIEFRSVLLKLERNEERRLYRTRTTIPSLSGRFVNPRPGTATRERAREIPIAVGGRLSETRPPATYAAPFASAELPQGELADSVDLLPDFSPPRPITPEEFAERMWKTEAIAEEPDDRDVKTMWSPPSAPAHPMPERTPARDRIAEAVVEALAQRFPRVLVFVSTQEGVQGWTGRGGGLARDRIASISIPWGEPSIFAFVKLSGMPHRGPLSRILIPPSLAEILGPKAAAGCVVVPVRIKDRLVAFLYADRLGAPLSEEDLRSLEISSNSLGSSLARLLLELRKAVSAG